MCTAKAITNGYFPFGAVMLNDRVAEVFENDTIGKANVGHGYTYSGHLVGAAAAVACLQEMERLRVHENVGQRGAELYQGLLGLKEKYDLVGDVRGGKGLMCALEIVSGRAAKTPIDKPTIGRIHQVTYDAGVMIRVSGANIILSTPLILTRDETAKIVSALDEGLNAA